MGEYYARAAGEASAVSLEFENITNQGLPAMRYLWVKSVRPLR